MLETVLWTAGVLLSALALLIGYLVIRYWGDDGTIGDDGRPDYKHLF